MLQDDTAETLAARMRSASQRANTLDRWGFELFRGLKLSQDKMRTEDLVWWRAFVAADAQGSIWRRVRRREVMQDVVNATGLLISEAWLWDIYRIEGEAL